MQRTPQSLNQAARRPVDRVRHNPATNSHPQAFGERLSTSDKPSLDIAAFDGLSREPVRGSNAVYSCSLAIRSHLSWRQLVFRSADSRTKSV